MYQLQWFRSDLTPVKHAVLLSCAHYRYTYLFTIIFSTYFAYNPVKKKKKKATIGPRRK